MSINSAENSGPAAVLSTGDADFDARLAQRLSWNTQTDNELVRSVADIIAAVRAGGDAAVLEYTQKFDRRPGLSWAELEISQQQLDAALSQIPDAERDALQSAAQRIEAYHRQQAEQLPTSWSYVDELGNELGQRVTPLARVGVYVPGGQATYPSTVLMTVIPARVAGVEDVVMTVPMPDGKVDALLLAAAAIAGVDRVLGIGGAQAIAALAYGTESIPRVDKIVGPGGAYVAEAKRQVFGPVAIDMIAGPSEILVIADDTANPRWVALDLFSQAEHDASAQAILLTPSEKLLSAVQKEIAELLPTLDRSAIIEQSLSKRGALIGCRDLAEAVAIANRIAPEHLAISVNEDQQAAVVDAIRHAGAIFIGAHSAEVMGDYAAGPSHVLPTFGTARYASPLGVGDFHKSSSMIRMDAAGVARVARIAATLARGEGLDGHARAAEARVKDFDHNVPD